MQPVNNRPHYKLAFIPVVLMFLCWLAAYLWWLHTGAAMTALLVGYIGLFIGVGVGLYLALPRSQRDMGRRIMMLMMGGLLLVVALTSGHGNMQIEGLFFGTLMGFAFFVVLHYTLAKIVGPLLFGRIWCGWACWFGMIFDLLPYKHSRYRIPGQWGALRYIHFALSLLLVVVLWFGFGYQGGVYGISGMKWFIGGLLLYYAVGIGMALILKDNRAFCKYLCPISVPLKTTSRFALLKVNGVAAKCDSCNVCTEMCPMNIRIPDYILKGERVLSTECTLCQTCINLCPQDALQLSFGLDVGGKELMDYVPPRHLRK